MLNYAFRYILVIFMAAIMKIGHPRPYSYYLRVNRLTMERSLNKMLQLTEGPKAQGCTLTLGSCGKGHNKWKKGKIIRYFEIIDIMREMRFRPV